MNISDLSRMWPNNSPEPTPIGAPVFTVDNFVPARLSFFLGGFAHYERR
jgi:hypothetical protein